MSLEDRGAVDVAAPTLQTKKMMRWTESFRRVLDNPVILKELRGRMRTRQAFVWLTLYVGLIAIFIVVIYSSLFSSRIVWNPDDRQIAGKVIFGTVVLLEFLLLGFIAPGLTAGAITSERERQTFDLLRTTLLSARDLVLGKVGSAFGYLFLLILTAIPIQSLAFFLGGVEMAEVVVSSLILVVTVLFYCALGIFFSSFMKRTLHATFLSNAVSFGSFLVLVILLFLIAYVESIFSTSAVGEQTLRVIAWFLISINPFSAAVMSEIILVEEQSLFLATGYLFGNASGHLPSPWIVYLVFYLALTFLLIAFTIRRIKRPDR